MKANKLADEVAKDAEIHQAIERVLKELEDRSGQEGFRHVFDKALHVLVAIDQAGFTIVRKRRIQEQVVSAPPR
jgi:hypothetical protein